MLIGLDLFTVVCLMAFGIGMDWLFGEPRRWHPLVGFGNWAGMLEKRLNKGKQRWMKGVAAWALAVFPSVAIIAWLVNWASAQSVVVGALLHIALLTFSLGLRSLRDHMLPIADALSKGDIHTARALTSRIVTRDTSHSGEPELAKAAVESLLENGNDAVFGTLFWFVVAGGPGALLFRLANTLDAMWGYRNARFHAFGWMAARTDDALNWIPARLTALSYSLLGDTRCALHCWKIQAPTWSSPNAGPVMSAGAGALGLALGGSAVYDGVTELRPPLGAGVIASARDIRRAWRLIVMSSLLWLSTLAVLAFILERIMHA